MEREGEREQQQQQQQQQQQHERASNQLQIIELGHSDGKQRSSRSLSSGAGMESDDEIGRVPEIAGGGVLAGASTYGRESGSGSVAAGAAVSQIGERRRGKSTADKEHKRLKRLLRNRVSAQQARERKKAYLNDIEVKVKELEKKNMELEERLSTLKNENQMLRKILKNTTANRLGLSSSNG